MKNCFCTLFDHRYLDRGLALYESILTHCEDFQLWVLCMDETCFKVLHEMKLEHVYLIRLFQLEKFDTPLLEVKESRTPVEYYFNCKPSLALYVLEQCETASQIIYLDADLYFFASPEHIYDGMGGNSIAVTPHRFRDELRSSERYGKFNAGYLLFKRDKSGIACLNWWRERCIEWCYDVVEEDRFADQKYIDRFSSLFDGVMSVDSLGVNLAPWNIDDKEIIPEGEQLYVDGQRIIFYHFHSLRNVTERVYDLGCDRYTSVLDKTVRKFLYKPYLSMLVQNKNDLLSVVEPLKRRGEEACGSVFENNGTVVGRLIMRINFLLTIARGLRIGRYMFAGKACS